MCCRCLCSFHRKYRRISIEMNVAQQSVKMLYHRLRLTHTNSLRGCWCQGKWMPLKINSLEISVRHGLALDDYQERPIATVLSWANRAVYWLSSSRRRADCGDQFDERLLVPRRMKASEDEFVGNQHATWGWPLTTFKSALWLSSSHKQIGLIGCQAVGEGLTAVRSHK
jgi:hypothetical protein